MSASVQMAPIRSNADEIIPTDASESEQPPESAFERAGLTADDDIPAPTPMRSRVTRFRIHVRRDEPGGLGTPVSSVTLGEESPFVFAEADEQYTVQLGNTKDALRLIRFHVKDGFLCARDLGLAGMAVNGVRVVEALLDGGEVIRTHHTAIEVARIEAPNDTSQVWEEPARADVLDTIVAESGSMSVARERVIAAFEHRYIAYLDARYDNERARVKASGVTDRYLRVLRKRARASTPGSLDAVIAIGHQEATERRPRLTIVAPDAPDTPETRDEDSEPTA